MDENKKNCWNVGGARWNMWGGRTIWKMLKNIFVSFCETAIPHLTLWRDTLLKRKKSEHISLNKLWCTNYSKLIQSNKLPSVLAPSGYNKSCRNHRMEHVPHCWKTNRSSEIYYPECLVSYSFKLSDFMVTDRASVSSVKSEQLILYEWNIFSELSHYG